MVVMVRGVGRTPGSLRGARAKEGESEPQAKVWRPQSPKGSNRFEVSWGPDLWILMGSRAGG